MLICCLYVFVFFKQKTAYELLISDWSSDVCSSDLSASPPRSRCRLVVERNADQGTTKKPKPVSPDFSAGRRKETGANGSRGDDMNARPLEIGRASGRERVCQ